MKKKNMKWHEMMKTHQSYKQIQTRSAGMDGCWFVCFFLPLNEFLIHRIQETPR